MTKPSQTALEAARRIYIAIVDEIFEDGKVINTPMLAGIIDEHYAELRQAVWALRSAVDRLMGDSDLPDDDSQEIQAMKFACEALARATPGGDD